MNNPVLQSPHGPFQCLRCGRCCTGEGYVNLSNRDCEGLAGFLGLSLDDFLDRYTVKKPGYQRYLIDGPGEEQPCIFLDYDAEGLALCRVHGPAKPQQCKDFPRKWMSPDAGDWCEGLIAERRKSEQADG